MSGCFGLLGLTAGPLGTMEMVFLVLWVLFTALYFGTYKRSESLLGSTAKVGGLLLFVYAVIKSFDWMASPVAPEQAITLGLIDQPTETGPRIPLMAYALEVFGGAIVLLIIWHARTRFSTVGSLILSAWDRGHWYMLPVVFILLTVGLLLVAAAASPVLSPFIYTLF